MRHDTHQELHMLEDHVGRIDHVDGGSWSPGYYWLDETEDLIGPYATQAEAKAALDRHVESLHE